MREVPRGPLGMLEVFENFNNDDGVTACEEDDLAHEINRHTDDVKSLSIDTLSTVARCTCCTYARICYKLSYL